MTGVATHLSQTSNVSLKPVIKRLPSTIPANHPAENHFVEKQCPIVFLHGWGCDSEVWGGFSSILRSDPRFAQRDILLINLPGFGNSPLPDQVALESILTILSGYLPDRMVLVGWSLGGMIATAFAASWPDRVSELICLGTNASYIQRPNWPSAIPESNLALFKKHLQEDPHRCLNRFRATQVHNDTQQKQLLQILLGQKAEFTQDWIKMLELLEQINNLDALKSLTVKTLYLFGEQDTLVPKAAALLIEKLNPSISTETLPGVAHTLHLSAPNKLLSLFSQFLSPANQARNKHQVALSFSRSAASYDKVAHLQRFTGDQLLKKLPSNLGDQPTILDLGCGTGHFKSQLETVLPQAKVMGLDLAEGMLHFAKTKTGAEHWCCGDAEQLPIASNTLDLVFSNLTIQWCDNLHTVAGEIYRVLKPGGVALISTLGEGTLQELRTAWSEVDQYQHVNQFLPSKEIYHQFARWPFSRCECHEENRLSSYQHLISLLRELKNLGAHNVNQGRPTTLTGKRRIAELEAHYEKFRLPNDTSGAKNENDEPGLLPATWEVVNLVLQKPQTADC